MLRITARTSPEALTFLVEGKLVGEWAKELERTWEQNAAERTDRASIIDLSETQFIDSQGRQILAKLFGDGAFFRTACPMIESIVSEIILGDAK
jgi:anti-anti-sigma regulatory factor